MNNEPNAFLPVKGQSERKLHDRALHAIQPILESNSHDADDPPTKQAAEEMAVSV